MMTPLSRYFLTRESPLSSRHERLEHQRMHQSSQASSLAFLPADVTRQLQSPTQGYHRDTQTIIAPG